MSKRKGTGKAAGKASSGKLSRGKTIALTVAASLIVCMVILYAPARDYYVAQRDQAKAEVAYELVSARNEALVEDVALLSSPEGMESKVRAEYGWVKQGENAVLVSGLSHDNDPTIAEVLQTTTLGNVKAPETWYSPFFDRFFGYEN